jgi:hypothetical protein
MNMAHTTFRSKKNGVLVALTILGFIMLASPAVHAWGWGGTTKGSGNVVTTTRTLTGYQGVELAIPADVTLIQGQTESVVLETDDNIAPLIETTVERGQLRIRLAKRGDSVQTKTLRMTVTAPNFNELAVSGSGNLRGEGLKAEKLKTSIAGSGDIQLDKLNVDELSIAIAGSGNFVASGRADSMKASIAGSGDVRTRTLETKAVKLSIAGSGNAAVWATEILKISIAGSGDVQYFGDATVSQSIAGVGAVRRMGSKP